MRKILDDAHPGIRDSRVISESSYLSTLLSSCRPVLLMHRLHPGVLQTGDQDRPRLSQHPTVGVTEAFNDIIVLITDTCYPRCSARSRSRLHHRHQERTAVHVRIRESYMGASLIIWSFKSGRIDGRKLIMPKVVSPRYSRSALIGTA